MASIGASAMSAKNSALADAARYSDVLNWYAFSCREKIACRAVNLVDLLHNLFNIFNQAKHSPIVLPLGVYQIILFQFH